MRFLKWVSLVALLAGCGGAGKDGQDGTPGSAGVPGPAGQDGRDGNDGTNGTNGVDGQDGADGEDGAKGDDGEPGAPGADGATILTGAGAPSNSLGADGDLYIDTTNRDVYKKVAGSWGSPITNLSSGTPGTNGTSMRSGTGAPSNSLGIDGDVYIDTATGDLYAKASGTWSQVGNLNGTDGADGSQWLTGSGPPGPGLGENGDVYLDEDSGNIYTKSAGTWLLSSTLDVVTFLEADWYEFANGAATAEITENTAAAIQATLNGAANGNSGIGFSFAKYGNVSFDPASTLTFTAQVTSGQTFLVQLAGLWGDAGCSYELAGDGTMKDYAVDLADLVSNTGSSVCWGSGFTLDSVNSLGFANAQDDASNDFTIRITEVEFVQ